MTTCNIIVDSHAIFTRFDLLARENYKGSDLLANGLFSFQDKVDINNPSYPAGSRRRFNTWVNRQLDSNRVKLSD